jgi:hypothetical protein
LGAAAVLAGLAPARPSLADDGHAEASLDDILRSPLGALLRGPWLDSAALRVLTSAVLPSSRLWASAEAAGFELERFVAANPRLDHWLARRRIASILPDLAAQHRRMRDAEATALTLIDPATTPEALAAAEIARIAATQPYVLSRLRFIEFAPMIDAVAFAIAPEAALVARFGPFEAEPASAYRPTTVPEVIASRKFRTSGATVRLLRFAPPTGDVPGPVIARVIEPEGLADPPSYVHCHGIGIDAQQYDPVVDDIAALVGAGIRVVRLVLPWHGRRRAPGTWSGEPVLAAAPLAPLALCAAAAQEIAIIVAWLRGQGSAAVGIGGISLGAFAAQLAVAHCGGWPAAMRPDAVFLANTAARFDRIALEGELSRRVGLDRALAAAGWTPERLARWRRFTDATQAQPLDPRRIVMALATEDEIAPLAGGMALAAAWGIPQANLFIHRLGHFTLPSSLDGEGGPLARFAAILHGVA